MSYRVFRSVGTNKFPEDECDIFLRNYTASHNRKCTHNTQCREKIKYQYTRTICHPCKMAFIVLLVVLKSTKWKAWEYLLLPSSSLHWTHHARSDYFAVKSVFKWTFRFFL